MAHGGVTPPFPASDIGSVNCGSSSSFQYWREELNVFKELERIKLNYLTTEKERQNWDGDSDSRKEDWQIVAIIIEQWSLKNEKQVCLGENMH